VYRSTGIASSPPGGLSLVGCNANGTDSSVSFDAESPGVYYIQAGGANGATGTLDLHAGCGGDFDCDGCGDGAEAGLALDPNDQWDFYNVPVPALAVAADPAAATRDHTVSAGDAQAVFTYFKAFAHTGTQVYEQDLDLDGVKDGIEYDRRSLGAASSGPPDGVISAQEAQLAFSQFRAGYHC
jgi:hypothetical protein